MIYTFKSFAINTENFQLLKNDEPLSIEPQVFNIILYLVENQDRVVSRDELLDTIWKDKIVSDASISNHIKLARKALDDDGVKQAIIKTIHGRGYQFIANCECIEEPEKKKQTDLEGKNNSKPKPLQSLLLTILMVVLVGTWLIKPGTAALKSTAKMEKSIAVLAFKDFSPKSDQAYFAEGMSEELINLFTRIPGLRVASRTSSFSFKNKDIRLREIGKELNVDYVMEGSVRKSGNLLRITIQLIRVNDESHIWSETYDHDVQDIFEVQDEIAIAVTEQLKINLIKGMIKSTPVDSTAYTLYLQAIYLLKENTQESITKALKLIGNSIAIDANYAPAWTVYSRILYTVAVYSYKKENKGAFVLAKQAVIKALEIDPSYAKAYGQMVLINLLEWDMQAAQKNIDKAMNLNEKSSSIIGVAAYHLQLTGQLAKNIKMLENAINFDPLNDIHYLNLGIVYLLLYRLDEAYSAIEKYEYYHPEAVAMHAMKSHVLLAMGKNKEALIEANKEVNDYWKLSTLGFATYANGDFNRADEILDELIDVYGTNLPGHIASLYAFRNDSDNAFKWLEISYVQHQPGLIHVINFQSLRNLWSDPRWDVFIKKIGLQKGHWLLEKRLDG